MSKEPLLILFTEGQVVTYVCYNCGLIEERFCKTDKKFKSFVKQRVTKDNCNECKSPSNLFKDPYGRQYWINN